VRALGLFFLALFVVCLALLLITSNLRGLVNELRLYEWGFEKYRISQNTGVPEEDLARTAKGLIDYFNLRKDSPQIQVLRQGQEIQLFNQRELAHLEDVRNLIQRCYQVQWASLAYFLGYLLLGFIWLRKAFFRPLARGLFFGGLLTLSLFVFIGAWALIDFESFFLVFHLTSFRNELWMLDPSKDYLIAMFPEGFFFHAALFFAGAVMAEAAILASISWAYLRRFRKQRPLTSTSGAVGS